MSLPPETATPLSQGSEPVRTLRRLLEEAVTLRVTNIPRRGRESGSETPDIRVAVLFSGGLDCTVLARLASDAMPQDQGIDLVNVAFENPRLASRVPNGASDIYEACPDRITGRSSFAELRRVCPERAWRFIAVCAPSHLFQPEETN